jgi:hypothetical protein
MRRGLLNPRATYRYFEVSRATCYDILTLARKKARVSN